MKNYLALMSLALILVIGCSSEPTNSPPQPAPSNDVTYLLKSEPKDAAGVIQVRKDAKDAEEVVIVGRIGGSENPWIKGRAAFTIVDTSLKSCKECGSHDCPKPWDYC